MATKAVPNSIFLACDIFISSLAVFIPGGRMQFIANDRGAKRYVLCSETPL